MLTLTYNQRQNLSVMLLVSMIFSLWVAVAPTGQLQASFFGKVGSFAKSVFVNVGGIATGLVGGALGMAIGGGPLGMGVGAVGGFIVGKKVLNWTTSSVANFATVAGAIAGGALCLGMGLPMLAVGAIGGGLIARLAVTGIQKLFGKEPLLITQGDINAEAAAKEKAEAASFLAGLAGSDNDPVINTPPPITETPANSATVPIDSRTAYDNYLRAYKGYMEATKKGDVKAAQAAHAEYKNNLEIYNALLKVGK